MPSFKEYFYCYIEKTESVKAPGQQYNVYRAFGIDDHTSLVEFEIPIIYNGDFSCFSNPSITSLEGGPKIVYGNYDCYDNPLLYSLVGGPSSVDKNFICYDNPELHILKDSGISYIGKDMYLCNCPKIQEDQWRYLPIIGGTLITDKNLNRNELLTLQKLQAQGRIGKLMLTGKSEEIEDSNDPFNL